MPNRLNSRTWRIDRVPFFLVGERSLSMEAEEESATSLAFPMNGAGKSGVRYVCVCVGGAIVGTLHLVKFERLVDGY